MYQTGEGIMTHPARTGRQKRGGPCPSTTHNTEFLLRRGESSMKSISRGVFFVFLLTAGFGAMGHAATYTAASCNRNDVNAVINGPTHTAANGDVIQIPAGTCTWTSPLSVSVGISVIGAGAASTIINSSYSGTLLSISIPSATSSTFRLSGMTIQPLSISGLQLGIANITGTCNSTTCSNIRLDNLTISGWLTSIASYLVYTDNVFGVIDHITLSCAGYCSTLVHVAHSSYDGSSDGYGDASWASADSFGSVKALYIESNTLTSASGMAVTDADEGGRFVVRFNNFQNVSVQTHGTETSGRYRGARQIEVYGNTYTITPDQQADMVGWRSGVGLLFNNTYTGGGTYIDGASLSNYRDGRSFSPWGYCDGLGSYDKNDGTVYASGTVTSSSGSGTTTFTVVDSTKSWTANQWATNPPYSIVDVSQQDANGYYFGVAITSNNATSVTSTNCGSGNGQFCWAWQNGDSYQILRASACLDQPGYMGGSRLSGWTPSPTNANGGYVYQTLDPIYEWETRSAAAAVSDMAGCKTIGITALPPTGIITLRYLPLPEPLELEAEPSLAVQLLAQRVSVTGPPIREAGIRVGMGPGRASSTSARLRIPGRYPTRPIHTHTR